MNGIRVQKVLTLLLPILSVTVSAGIVTNQYSRDAAINRRLRASRDEKQALLRLLPARQAEPQGNPGKADGHNH